MLKNKTFTAIIPARGGSKGIQNKNIKELCGKPLIYWCIKAAKKSGIFESIIVSSDDKKILKLARKYGVLASKRPNNLATDASPVIDTMSYMLRNLAPEYKTDYAQLIQPTSPLISHRNIRSAAKQLIENDMDFCVSITESSVPLGVVKPLPFNMNLKGWFPKELRHINRQHVDTSYCLNGVIYLGKWDIWKNKEDWWEYNVWPFVMSKDSNVDINDKRDWSYAEFLLRERLHKEKHPLVFRDNVNPRNFHPESDLGTHTND